MKENVEVKQTKNTMEHVKNKSHEPVVSPKPEERPNSGSNTNTNGYIQEVLQR